MQHKPTGLKFSLHPLLAKLQTRANLSAADCNAIMSLDFIHKRLRPGDFIVRQGDAPTKVCVLLDGFAYRHKIAGDGGRQIFSINMKGDVVDLQSSLLAYADHNLQALTGCDVAYIPMSSIPPPRSRAGEHVIFTQICNPGCRPRFCLC